MFSSLWQRYKNLTRLQNQRFCTGPENLVTRKLVMRTYLAIRKAEPRRSGVKSPRLNDSSNPLFLFQRKKRAQLCSLSSWQRYKNLNASVQNLVTRYARNKDSSNPYLLLSKKKTDIRMDVCFLLAENSKGNPNIF